MAVPNTIPPHLRHITIPEREDRTPGLLQRVGGLLQRGLQAYGGLFAGNFDPEATEAQNREARQRALLAAASALAGQQGFDAIPRAALVGREVADETRQALTERAQERERQQRIEGLLAGGLQDESTIRGLLGEAIRTGDVGSAQVLRGLLSDLQPGTPLVVRDGADTVLLDPQTRQEIQRFEGERELGRAQLGDNLVFFDPVTGEQRGMIQGPAPRPTPAQARAERQEQQANRLRQAQSLASYVVQNAQWGDNGPDSALIARVVQQRFPDMDRTEVAGIVRDAINEQRQFNADIAFREGRVEPQQSSSQTDRNNAFNRLLEAGRTPEQIRDMAISAFGEDGERYFNEWQKARGGAQQQAAAPASGDFGPFSDLVRQ